MWQKKKKIGHVPTNTGVCEVWRFLFTYLGDYDLFFCLLLVTCLFPYLGLENTHCPVSESQGSFKRIGFLPPVNVKVT